MASGTKSVAVGTDDGWVNSTLATFDNNDNLISMGFDAAERLHGWLGFADVDIGVDGAVDAFVIDFVAHSTSVATCPTLRIYGVLGQTVPGSYSAFTGLELTDSYIEWADEPQWSGGDHYTTPDLSVIAEEIVNSAAWTNPGKMIFVIKDAGTDPSGIARYAASFDHSSYDPPHVDYTWHEVSPPPPPAEGEEGVPLIYVKNGGVWLPIDAIYVKDEGEWKPVDTVYVKDEGDWKQVI